MLSAELVVESMTMSPEDVSAHVGRQPDRAEVLGEKFGPVNQPRRAHRWVVAVPVDDPYFGDPELGISASLTSLGTSFARRLGTLPDTAAKVVLSICQEVNGEDDHLSKGITFSPAAIAWLSAAGASISLDQYFIP